MSAETAIKLLGEMCFRRCGASPRVFRRPELDANHERVKADVWEWGKGQVALLGLDSGEVRAAQYVTDEVRAGLERIAMRARVLES